MWGITFDSHPKYITLLTIFLAEIVWHRLWGYYISKSRTESNMAPRRKTTRGSLSRYPTPLQSQQPHVLVESLAIDDDGSTPRNDEHSAPREDPVPVTMADIKRIPRQLNDNMQRSLQELNARIPQVNQGHPKSWRKESLEKGMIFALTSLTPTDIEWGESSQQANS